ncbi:hypothetical protein [Bacillus sp. 03113]|uniref:hypothetical protein n=1 Tax=Bacillus sp. 03113 TaxID=2578211 RepID=UPI0011447DD2|nr:hypothetical protein [Bacillus sp. 03113]
MATLAELSERLLKRFKNVPNVAIEDTNDWTEESMLAHGYQSTSTVPTDQETLILLYAQAEGLSQISLATAHYFKYTDGEEQVDKTMIPEQYRKLAKDIREEYERKKSVDSGASVRYMKRVDRP